MIVDFSKNPELTVTQKIQSLRDSVQRAFDEAASQMNDIETKVADASTKAKSSGIDWMITAESYSLDDNSQSLPAGSYDTFEFTVSNPGYRPIGIEGYSISGTNSSYILPYRIRLTDRQPGVATVVCALRNFHESNAYSGTIYPDILWFKE